MKEDLVKSGEYFPKGGFTYLENICRWATDAGMYIIIGKCHPNVRHPERFTGLPLQIFMVCRAHNWNASHLLATSVP